MRSHRLLLLQRSWSLVTADQSMLVIAASAVGVLPWQSAARLLQRLLRHRWQLGAHCCEALARHLADDAHEALLR